MPLKFSEGIFFVKLADILTRKRGGTGIVIYVSERRLIL